MGAGGRRSVCLARGAPRGKKRSMTAGDEGARPGVGHDAAAHAEKRWVALSSVVAAVFLTGMKLTVGVMSGSLGILSEALHSGLDLVAALVTFWAVRAASRPADRDHTYGHGKVENLSALFETALLLVTCVWIVYEAVERLLFTQVEVHASVWAFLVVAISIVVDISRSRQLAATAKKYDSQALEADALHFSTDVWSSGVVLVGLACVAVAGPLGMPWLVKADAVAALGVAVIVVWVSLKLGRKSVDDLLDAVPADLRERVARAAAVPGVASVERVRVRKSGPEAFVDVTITAAPEATFEQAHDLTRLVEAAVRAEVPGADVVVHVEPTTADNEDPVTRIHLLAARRGVRVHSVVVDADVASLHLEIAPDQALTAAHELATALERDVREDLPALARVVTHIEPRQERTPTMPAPADTATRVTRAVERICERTRGCGAPHDLDVREADGLLDVSFHCVAAPDADVARAHQITHDIETALRVVVPSLRRVTIHIEPPDLR